MRHAAAVLAVSGLAGEAKIAAGPGVVALAAPPAVLAGKLQAQDAANLCAVLSFGLAGGLAPALAVGDIVLASTIAAPQGTLAGDAALADRLAAALIAGGINPHRGTMAAVAAPILMPAQKRALASARTAIAVDTESHLAAEFASRHGLPFAALRVICDPVHQALPPLAVRAIGPDGRLDGGAILAELIARPGQLARLPATALCARRAMRALGHARAVLGPGFGLLG